MIKRRPLAAGTAAVAAALALTAPALAQRSDDRTALETLATYTSCAVKMTPDGAVALLQIDPESADFAAAQRRYAVGHERCLPRGGRLAFGGLLFSGFLAEALFRDRLSAQALTDAAALTVDGAGAGSIAEGIGRCMARRQPAALEQLFRTTPGSADETSALQLTGTDLPACVPQGVTMTLNKPAARAMYALGAYALLAGNSRGEQSEAN